MPVESADWQSTLPHAHSAELAEDPSDTEQSGGREQVLDDFVHTSPVPDPRVLLEQSTLPQAQASELAADPSVKVQGECLLHRFSDCLQNMPVVLADLQSILPQEQAAELAEDPSIERQSQYRAAMDPLSTFENIPVLYAELSTHAGSQSGGWLKLYADENTEEGQRNQQAEGRRETEENLSLIHI